MRGDPLRRAQTAYLREAIRHGEFHPPAVLAAGIVEVTGTTYVVLRHGPALLAIYKLLKSNGTLQRVHRWPAALEEE